MNAHVQQCNLETFLDDVAMPAYRRFLTSQLEGMEVRAAWAAGEVREAADMLELGVVLRLFPRDWTSRAHGERQGFLKGLPGTRPYDALVEGHLLSIDMSALGRAEAVPEPSSKRERRALARAQGLFRSTYLCASALGHGVAADALALISAGQAQRLLARLHEAEKLELEYTLSKRGRVLQALANPDAEFEFGAESDGAVLAASVFHAVEFLYTVGFVHEERELSIYGEETLPDPLHDLIGLSTGDLLHRLVYWRLPVTEESFRTAFLQAVRSAAALLFQLRMVDHSGEDDGDAAQFADVLASRVSRAADVWGRAFVSNVRWGSGSVTMLSGLPGGIEDAAAG